MLAARSQAIKYLKGYQNDKEDSDFLPKLVAYCSKESHSCVEKAAMISLVKLRILETNEDGSLSGETLHQAMLDDESKGLFPFFLSTTYGSTACTSFDNLEEIGPVCRSRPYVWLHVDGAYGGNAFICREFRDLMSGIEYADSININTNKWLLTNFDCSCLWVRDRIRLTSAMVVDPIYLQHANSDEAIDYRHWQIPLSRRFRALKLWFVIRKYGISGLQAYIRNHVRLARYFESLVQKDNRFEVLNEVRLGLVCFRLKVTDEQNQSLLAQINDSGELHMIPAIVKGRFIIRFCVTAENATEDDMDQAWDIITAKATAMLQPPEKRIRPPLQRTKSKRFSFTRSVSREVFKRSTSRSSLFDGATPILVVDDDTNCFNGIVKEEDDACDKSENNNNIKDN